MKHLISVNYKLFDIAPIKLVLDWHSSLALDGAEVFIRLNEQSDLDYILKLTPLMKIFNLKLQIHAPNLDMLDSGSILLFFNKLADLYEDTILLVSHPVHCLDVEESVNKSIIHLNSIMNKIEQNNFNLSVCVENLNPINGIKRPNTKDINKIISCNNNHKFCWDIGHAIHSGEEVRINKDLISRLVNVHIHDLKDNVDHHPFRYNEVDLNEITNYLNLISYNGSIVHELALDYLDGDSTEKKHSNFLEEIHKTRCYMNETISYTRFKFIV